MIIIKLSHQATAILKAHSHDPFSWLGRHSNSKGGVTVRAFKPRAEKMWLLPDKGKACPMTRIEGTGFFEKDWKQGGFDKRYLLRIENHDGHQWEEEDVYRFGTMLGDLVLHLIC
jgi:1,4-alpha-glucan branching enzyme